MRLSQAPAWLEVGGMDAVAVVLYDTSSTWEVDGNGNGRSAGVEGIPHQVQDDGREGGDGRRSGDLGDSLCR